MIPLPVRERRMTTRRGRTRRFVACAVLLAAGLGGCRDERASTSAGEGAPRGEVVATLDGEPILAAELRAGGAGRAQRPVDAGAGLDAVIARKFVANEARRRGLDGDAAVRAEIDAIRGAARRREEQVLREAMYQSLYDDVAINEAALRAHWEETRSRYLERHYRFRRRILPSPEAARELDASLGATGRLDAIAADEIGPAAAHDLPREILPDALRLRAPGARTVIAVGDAGHLVEMVEILPAVPRPLEEVKDRVEESLRNQRAQQAFEALVAELEPEAEITVDTEAVAAATADQRD